MFGAFRKLEKQKTIASMAVLSEAQAMQVCGGDTAGPNGEGCTEPHGTVRAQELSSQS